MAEVKSIDITDSTQVLSSGKDILIRFINGLRCIDCGHYVDGDWHCQDGKIYCRDDWEAKMEQERIQRQKEIGKLLNQLEAYGVSVTIVDNESNSG